MTTENMEPEEFYARAVQPEFGDKMNLSIERLIVDDKFFSEDALRDMGRKFQAFVAARCIAQHAGSGKIPRRVVARVVLDFDSPPLTQETSHEPWYRAAAEVPDGFNRRLP